MLGYTRWQLFKGLVAAVGVLSIVSLALIYFLPSPPSKVVMATGNKGDVLPYYGQQYREVFVRFHIEVELRETSESSENIKILQYRNCDVEIALMVGGISDGKNSPGLLSLGTVYNNPY